MNTWSLAQAVGHNLADFWKAAAAAGLKKEFLLAASQKACAGFSALRQEQVKELAERTGCSLRELVCFNCYADLLMPEDCTVYFAAGTASAGGWTVFGKNSANFFNILPQLNAEGNISSFCRYHRSQQLLQVAEGNVTADTLIAISKDHENGPGANSICRHSHGMESATLAAAVMELNGGDPKKSVIQIALGTPCTAWSSPEGHITLTMETPEAEIPEGFKNGEVFRKFCLNDPV